VSKNNNSEPREYFVNLSSGKLTGLRGVTDENGKFKVLALDQSNSFKKFLRKLFEKTGRKAEPSYEDVRDAKLEITKELAGAGGASAVLLDVNYGVRQAINAGVLPKGVGLIVRCEASRDPGVAGEYEPGWNVDKIKRMGGTAVKLLVYLDVEDQSSTNRQVRFMEDVANACLKNDILLMVEELSYPRPGETKQDTSYKKRLPNNIFKATEILNPFADILKLEFPGDIENDSAKQIKANLAQLDRIAQRPWVLLSAGVKFPLFEKQVALTMQAGASGTMAGRAIFQEYFDQATPAARKKFLQKEGVLRMKKLNKLVDQYADSWQKRYDIADKDMANAVNPNWYKEGEEAAVATVGATTGEY